jgi:hypothetical protein
MAASLFQAHSQNVAAHFSRKSPAFRVKRGTNRTEIVTRKKYICDFQWKMLEML